MELLAVTGWNCWPLSVGKLAMADCSCGLLPAATVIYGWLEILAVTSLNCWLLPSRTGDFGRLELWL